MKRKRQNWPSTWVGAISRKSCTSTTRYSEILRTNVPRGTMERRTLRDRVRSMLFERTAISRQPETLIHQELEQLRETDRVTPDLVFRDPYLLDFLGLADAFSERDLETAILRDIERFLLELGTDLGFSPARSA